MHGLHDPPSASFDRASGIAADALSSVLLSVRLSGASFFLIHATDPYCVDLPEADSYRRILDPQGRHIVSYHVILEGAGVVRVPGQPEQRYRAGDIVLIPRGDAYLMGTRLDVPPEFDRAGALAFFGALAEGALPFVIPEGGGGAPLTRVLCGFLGCDSGPFNPVLDHLPRLLVLGRPETPEDMLSRLIDMTLAEAEAPAPGGASIRLRLSELLFVEVLRRHIAALPQEGTGWLAGLRDPVLARALSALHAAPARGWSLPELAAAAGTSRSVLSDRFAAMLGMGPAAYLARWRAQLAARALADTDDKVGAIALSVGFGSEAAFSRAFKRIAGVPPATWRQRCRGDSPGDSPDGVARQT